MKDLLSTPIDT
jgi:chromosome segregation ATPase